MLRRRTSACRRGICTSPPATSECGREPFATPTTRVRAEVAEAIEAHEPLTLELLYSDQIGQQRTITRFSVMPTGETWLLSVTRHWYLDWDGPRPERDVAAATETVLRDHEAHQRAHSEEASPPLGNGNSATGDAAADGNGSGESAATRQ